MLQALSTAGQMSTLSILNNKTDYRDT